jgi:hypothetical protein
LPRESRISKASTDAILPFITLPLELEKPPAVASSLRKTPA